MKRAILLLSLASFLFGPAISAAQSSSGALRVELRASSVHVRMSDEIGVTVFFRSPEKKITIWNALAWGVPAGLYLQVFDSSGNKIENGFAPFYHPVPPDLSGKNALISIGGSSFAGFDSQISAKSLFPKAGHYTIRCLYTPPLPRNYFEGYTIWGKEDGGIESAPVSIVVDM